MSDITLEEVNTAIRKVLNCQEYFLGGRRVRYAQMNDLMKLRKEIIEEQVGSSSSPTTVAMFDEPK